MALARLQRALPGRVTLVTQNIDDLHERAGADDVIHMHGEILSALCAVCGRRWRFEGAMADGAPCPGCAGTDGVRPDVVWFGEIPYRMDEILERLGRATLFAAIGTSGAVYPAAGFVAEAGEAGAETVEINLAPSDVSPLFDRHIRGRASEAVPGWVEEVIAATG